MAYICGDKESIQNAEGIARGMMEAWNKNNPPETNGCKFCLRISLVPADEQIQWSGLHLLREKEEGKGSALCIRHLSESVLCILQSL